MPIVYILTNESMPDVIKVGVTDNLEERIKKLDSTNTPLPFECYYAVEVEDASGIEKKMHLGLDDYRIRQNREFFGAAPEKAKAFLEIAEKMGGRNVTPSCAVVESPQDQQALDNAHNRRKRFNFSMLDIQPGTELQFKKDNTITCEVIDDKRVMFRGEEMSLSSSANTILLEMGFDWGGAVQGPIWWCLDGRTLDDLRRMNDE